MLKTTEKDLEAIGTFFTALASSLLPDDVEFNQQFPWEQPAQKYGDILQEFVSGAFAKDIKDEEVQDQPLRAAKLYISTEEIAARLGIAEPRSIVVADVQNNNTSDSSVVELTVFIDSTAKQDLESTIEISNVFDGINNLRRQTLLKPECNTACKYKTTIDLLNEKLNDLLNQRDVMNYTYGDLLFNAGELQNNFANLIKKIRSLEKTIEVLSEDNK